MGHQPDAAGASTQGCGGKSLRGWAEGKVRLARELGISPRRLDGWEPAETTTVYSPDGEVVSQTITVREPEFTPTDVAVMLESRRLDAQPRGPHGLLLRDATDPAMNPFSVDSRGRFVAEPVIDFAQDAIDRAKAARRKKVADGDDWALIWRVTPELYD